MDTVEDSKKRKLVSTLGGFEVKFDNSIDPQLPVFDFAAGTVRCSVLLLNEIQLRCASHASKERE